VRIRNKKKPDELVSIMYSGPAYLLRATAWQAGLEPVTYGLEIPGFLSYIRAEDVLVINNASVLKKF